MHTVVISVGLDIFLKGIRFFVFIDGLSQKLVYVVLFKVILGFILKMKL